MSFNLTDIIDKGSLEFKAPETTPAVTAEEQPDIVNNVLREPQKFPTLDKIQEVKDKIKETSVIPGESKFSVEQLAAVTETIENTPVAENTETGRPATSKEIAKEYLKTKIESGDFFTWSDYDENKQSLEDYIEKMNHKEVMELLDKNIEKKKNIGYEEAPKQLRDALPPKLQYAIDYLAQGGSDLEDLLGTVLKSVQIEKLDPENEEHMPEIARQYLQSTNFGNSQMINEQVQEWTENGKLAAKVKQFKPILDQIGEQQIQYKIQQEAEENQKRQELAQMYVNNIGETLSKFEIGGLKIAKKTANDLYYQLTQPVYQDRYGNPTNIIGHTLDTIQYVQPDYDFLSELAWHMLDREGYNKAQAQKGANGKTLEIVKELKDAQYVKTPSSPVQEPIESKIIKMNKPRNVLQRS